MSPESPRDREFASPEPHEPFLYTPAREEHAGPGNSAAAQFRELTKVNAESVSVSLVEQRAFEKGLAEGEARARAAFEKALAEARSQISVALRQFTSQRESYFERVESEVVHLALVHRAQDPSPRSADRSASAHRGGARGARKPESWNAQPPAHEPR